MKISNNKINSLIIGSGPAGITTAVNLSKKNLNTMFAIATRKSKNSLRFKKELEENGYNIISKSGNEKFENIEGTLKLNNFYDGFDELEDIWDIYFIAIPSDSYLDVIKEIDLSKFKKVKTIVLISPGIGSNLLISNYLKEKNIDIEVISFSTYYAASKIEIPKMTTSITNGIKKRIYIASSRKDSLILEEVKNFVEGIGVSCEIVSNSIEAEIKNINMYVHSPFCINEFSLKEIFSEEKTVKYIYKIYPEGPINQHSIRNMVNFWKEVSEFLNNFGSKPFNLLKFLNDDNYPVHEETLSREDVENFVIFNQIKQEYLLYIRYSSILIDPFSKPDKDGKYLEFSDFPFKNIYKDDKGFWNVPRTPFEDYNKLKLIYSIGRRLGMFMLETKKFIDLFEIYFNDFVSQKGRGNIKQEFFLDNIEKNVNIIMKGRESLNE